uniref:Uncharacterized protein n=1 Tax=Anguilla anguilla TaxID=7936 RepID=A0A0E9XMZ5_ANGAN
MAVIAPPSCAETLADCLKSSQGCSD